MWRCGVWSELGDLGVGCGSGMPTNLGRRRRAASREALGVEGVDERATSWEFLHGVHAKRPSLASPSSSSPLSSLATPCPPPPPKARNPLLTLYPSICRKGGRLVIDQTSAPLRRNANIATGVRMPKQALPPPKQPNTPAALPQPPSSRSGTALRPTPVHLDAPGFPPPPPCPYVSYIMPPTTHTHPSTWPAPPHPLLTQLTNPPARSKRPHSPLPRCIVPYPTHPTTPLPPDHSRPPPPRSKRPHRPRRPRCCRRRQWRAHLHRLLQPWQGAARTARRR
eukprot:12162-Chlamydomonas_euryale.AAC.1